MATFVKMPGTAGNFISTDDVNLLDADTAHTYQSFGKWSSLSATSIDEPAAFSGKALELLFGGTNNAFTTYEEWIVVDENTVYTYLAGVNPYVAGNRIRLLVDYYGSVDASVPLGNFTAYDGSSLPVGRQVVSGQFTTPAGCIGVRLRIYFTDNAGGTISETMAWDSVMIAEGTDAEFVPSLRIVGDLDVRFRGAAVEWGRSSDRQSYISRYGNSAATRAWLISDGVSANRLRLNIVDATGTEYSADSADLSAYLTDGVQAEIRHTFDISGPTWKVYVNDVEASSASAAFSGFTTLAAADTQSVTVGGNLLMFEGDVYWAEVRDGIGGPVVARVDAEDVPVVAQLPSP